MVMVGHSRRLAQPLRLRRRETLILSALAGCATLAVLALIVLGITQGAARTPAGCVQATTASYVGGGTVRACGTDARTLCRSTAGSAPGSAQAVVAAACRRSGFPISR
jgi:hypothetical protein